jgi:hypothetical protein
MRTGNSKVGLSLLFRSTEMNVVHVENDILLLDIELTLRRNKHDQSPEEDEWGFWQVLALLLLVIPLRDFVISILDI